MATLNYGTRQLDCKIVYYGPALGGKTTNLQRIHRVLPAESCGELTNLATKQDRTLYFDLLPVSLGRVGDYYVKVHLYTVPGQVYYNATRRVVLSGVDGIVMVFDSDPEREGANYQSLANLEENLESYGIALEDIPIVFQYNKRDLPHAMSVDFMSRSLNPEGLYDEFEAVAIEGDGVEETLRSICSQVFSRIEAEMPRRAVPRPNPRSLRPLEGPGVPRPAAPGGDADARATESAEPDALPAHAPPTRLRQLSDLRWNRWRVGHAVIDLTPTAGREGAPDLSAELEIRPALGAAHLEKLRFWRLPGRGTGSVEVFESHQAAGDRPSRLWRVPREGKPPDLFLDWPTVLGKIQVVPAGHAGAAGFPEDTFGGQAPARTGEGSADDGKAAVP